MLFGGCSEKEISVDYDPDYAIAAHHVYTVEHPGNTVSDPLNAERIERAIDKVLAAKGYRRDDRHFDFKVRYKTQLLKDVPSNVSIGFGFGSGGPGMGASVGASKRLSHDELRLGIQMIDAAGNKVFWNAAMQEKVDTKATPEAKTSFIFKSVSDMLKNYPKAKQ